MGGVSSSNFEGYYTTWKCNACLESHCLEDEEVTPTPKGPMTRGRLKKINEKLEKGLKLLTNYVGEMKTIDIEKLNGKVLMFVLHPLSQPKVIER
ncbi:hypothetical protein CR513_62834, partial [Mucuna pruriens]